VFLYSIFAQVVQLFALRSFASLAGIAGKPLAPAHCPPFMARLVFSKILGVL
jgi:hypothetical protein